ncbi:MAG: Na-translocating system protein MpsC family protein [Candidatus Binatia bacterium]
MRRLGLKQQLRHALGEFFARRVGGLENTELKIVGDLILLRCREAISPSEVNLGTLKSGRLLLQEVNERVCRELQPDLDRILREITGLHLVDICVGLFLERREKIFLFTMTDTVKQ